MASITPKIQDALNGQINAEMYSAHLYLAMSAYFEELDFAGFAHWMRIQYQEELAHVSKLFDYVTDRGGRVLVGGVEPPPKAWETPLAAFEAASEHEQHVTSLIGGLVKLAHEEEDHSTESLLRWYVDEQVEEEASVDRIVKQLRMCDSQPVALLMMDKELASRVFTPPPAA